MLSNGHKKAAGNRRREVLTAVCHLVLLMFLVWLAFGSALKADFVWDDHGLIVNNTQVKETTRWYLSFYRNFWTLGENMVDPTRSFYRPLISLSYTVDYALWRLNPYGFHLTNLLVHLCACWVAYAIGRRILIGRHMAFMATALFAVHPTHVENVSWISGRTDVFCGLFYLLAFLFFLMWVSDETKRSRYALLTALIYLFSLFSKEMALTFPILIAAYGMIVRQKHRTWRDYAYLLLLLMLVTVFYLFQRIIVLGHIVSPAAFGLVSQRVLSIPMVFIKYLGLLFNLLPVDPHHSDPLLPPGFSMGALVYSLLACSYGLVLFWAYLKGHRKETFLFVWVPLTLLPVYKLGTFGDVLYADRFLYIPSFGMALGILALAEHTPLVQSKRPVYLKAVGVVFWALIMLTMTAGVRWYAGYWRKDTSLFRRAAMTSPRSAYVQFNLGNSLVRDKKYEEALEVYFKAISLQPNYIQAYTNLGALLNKMGRHEEALAALDKALRLNDHTHVLYSNRAQAFRALGQVQSAIANYRRSIEIHPTVSAHNNLGECLMASGYPDLAYVEFLQGLRIRPTAATLNNIGLLLMDQERYGDALLYLQQALDLVHQDSSLSETGAIHYNLARTYHHMGRASLAERHARYAMNVAMAAIGTEPVDEQMLCELREIIAASSASE